MVTVKRPNRLSESICSWLSKEERIARGSTKLSRARIVQATVNADYWGAGIMDRR